MGRNKLPIGDLKFHDANRSGYQDFFLQKLRDEPGLRGRVLDIGCGPDLPHNLQPIREFVSQLDGLDPNHDEVEAHPLLTRRWANTLERAEIEGASYDLAYSYNVAEHVADPEAFLTKVLDVLKPGGVYWALSNHTLHPFARIVRLIETANLKGPFAKHSSVKVNDYPAFYRCCSTKQIAANCLCDQVKSIDFFHYPCMQWDRYFPTALRFLPHAFDRLFGTKYESCMMIFMVRIQKKTLL